MAAERMQAVGLTISLPAMSGAEPWMDEGSIEIPADLMAAVDLWPGEKVLVASVTSGNRLETYALQGPAGTGNIIMNGGAAHLIKTGERVVIMSFALSDKPIIPKKIVCNEHNEIIS